jgi:hypothetical protein
MRCYFEEANEVSFRGFLQSKDGLALESEIFPEFHRDFSHESLEGQLANQQVSLSKIIIFQNNIRIKTRKFLIKLTFTNNRRIGIIT